MIRLTMKWSFLLFSSFLCLQAIAQYPATGNKARLGWQTTGDGLVYRGAIGDTTTLDPSGLNNAWMLLDTASGNLYAYRAKAWRLVSGGGGSVSDTLTGEVKGPLDSTYIDTVANIIFRLDSTAVGVGEVKYNDTQGSIQQGLKGGNVTNVIGQQLHQRVLNKTGSPLAKGEAVYLQGSQGNRITVAKAIATIDSTSANTFGIVAESIANNQSGYIITEGLITGLNTNSLTEGAAVYLSPTVAGELTTTKPQAPQHTVYIGVCVKQNAGSGELFVKIRNGQELDELHDVRITSPASNASLYYNTSESVWRDTTGAVLTSDTSVFARDFQISGTTNYLAKFTGSNTVGNSWFSQSDSIMALNDTKKMQLYGRNGRRNYLEIFRNGTNTMQTNYVLATDTAYTASTGTTSRIYTHVVDNQNADYMISTYLGGGTGGFILLDALRTGIGTTTPAHRLDVNGDVNTTGMYKKSGTDIISGTTNYIPKFTGANTIGNSQLFDNGTNISLGSTNPISNGANSRWLTLYGSTEYSGGIVYSIADTAQAYHYLNADAGGKHLRHYANSGYGQTFFTNGSGTARMTISAAGDVTIPNAAYMATNSASNVGIGTESTTYKLDLNDQRQGGGITGMRISTYYYPGILFQSALRSNNGKVILNDFANGYGTGSLQSAMILQSPGAVQFSTGGDNIRTTIDASGNVGIATSSPSRPLHVNANSSMIIPSDATVTRPASGANGDLRYSTTFSNIEFYRTDRWMRPLVGTVANNKVAFASGDTLTSNTNFHFDNTNTRLGIGNAAPDSTLTVTGGIRTTTSIRTGSDAIINGMTVGSKRRFKV